MSSAAAPLRDVLRCCSASQYHQPLAPLRDVICLLPFRDAWRPTYLRPITQIYRMAFISCSRWCAFGIHQFPGTTTGFMVFSGFEPHTTIVNSYHCSSPYGLPIVRPSQMGRCVKINFTSVTARDSPRILLVLTVISFVVYILLLFRILLFCCLISFVDSYHVCALFQFISSFESSVICQYNYN